MLAFETKTNQLMKKIEKMVASYNKYAAAHGHSTISIDWEKRQIVGAFTPRDEHEHTGFVGFFKNMMTAGHNESLRADFAKIEKALKACAD